MWRTIWSLIIKYNNLNILSNFQVLEPSPASSTPGQLLSDPISSAISLSWHDASQIWFMSLRLVLFATFWVYLNGCGTTELKPILGDIYWYQGKRLLRYKQDQELQHLLWTQADTGMSLLQGLTKYLVYGNVIFIGMEYFGNPSLRFHCSRNWKIA